MKASTAVMTSGSNSNIATYQNIGSYTKMESLSKRNGSFEKENCFLGRKESLEIEGKMENKKQENGLKTNSKKFCYMNQIQHSFLYKRFLVAKIVMSSDWQLFSFKNKCILQQYLEITLKYLHSLEIQISYFQKA